MATKSDKSSGSQITARGINQGVAIVGPRSGLPIDEVVDSSGVRRLAVDSTVTFDATGLNVDLDYTEDSVSLGDSVSGNTLTIESDGSINTNIKADAKDGDNFSISAHNNQKFAQNISSIADDLVNEIFTYTSTDNNLKISAIHCTVSTPSVFNVYINNILSYQKWSSPLERNVIFNFTENRSLLATQIIRVTAQVERYIRPSYSTFVSMEGYIA